MKLPLLLCPVMVSCLSWSWTWCRCDTQVRAARREGDGGHRFGFRCIGTACDQHTV